MVAIIGVLAAVAIPAFSSYMRRSKAAEVSSNLNSLFKSSATYYSLERSGLGVGSAASGRCVVDDAGPSPVDPGVAKQRFVQDANFQALGFTIADLVYFSYGISSIYAGSSCGTSATQVVYTLYANGDLDGDNNLSTFEMIVAANENNLLYHSIGFYVVREDE